MTDPALDAAQRGVAERVLAEEGVHLEAAQESSVLPDEPRNRGELEEWLLEVRRTFWSP